MRYLFAILFVGSTLLASPTKVCVRNYPSDAEVSPCKKFPESYTYVIPWKPEIEDDSQVCTRIYGETYCEISPNEYRRIPTVDGKTICALDFDQPGIKTNFCESSAGDFYHYVMGMPSEN